MDALRRKIADLQKNLSPEDVDSLSGKASANLASWLGKGAPEPRIVGLYRPLEPNRFGEADPSALARDPAFSKTHFAFPRVLDRFRRTMDFAIPIHPTDWVVGVYGNPEPRPELPAVDSREFDAIVVPGVVFGTAGERIGRGAGFYDRYLVRAGGALRIGFGFDFQLLNDPVPQADWDARMDVVVTDRRAIETSARP